MSIIARANQIYGKRLDYNNIVDQTATEMKSMHKENFIQTVVGTSSGSSILGDIESSFEGIDSSTGGSEIMGICSINQLDVSQVMIQKLILVRKNINSEKVVEYDLLKHDSTSAEWSLKFRFPLSQTNDYIPSKIVVSNDTSNNTSHDNDNDNEIVFINGMKQANEISFDLVFIYGR